MLGWWSRPIAFRERCRARYGKRYTIRLPFTPPLVHLSDPDEVRQVFTAPPEVLHPGQGAQILEPVVGRNSVILLDEGAHLEQRKLMLPAFHGERMERLEGLVSEVAEESTDAENWAGPPWPFSRAEIESVAQDGVRLVSLETIRDNTRYWAEFTR